MSELGHLHLDLNENGMGAVTLDGVPMATAGVDIVTEAGIPTRATLHLPVLTFDADVEAETSYTASLVTKEGPIGKGTTLVAAIRHLADQLDV